MRLGSSPKIVSLRKWLQAAFAGFAASLLLAVVLGVWPIVSHYRQVERNLRGIEAHGLLLTAANRMSAERGPSNVILSIEPGGYTMAGAIFGTFFERWRGPARVAIVCAYLLSISVDVNWAYLGSFTADSYRTHRPVYFETWVTAGPFIRPGLVLAMQWSLCWATLRDVFASGARAAHAPVERSAHALAPR